MQIRYNSTFDFSESAAPKNEDQFTNPEHKSTDGGALPPTKVVYVGNIQFDATPETLGEEFKKFGNVLGAKIIYDSRGLSKGYVFVFFSISEGFSLSVVFWLFLRVKNFPAICPTNLFSRFG